MPERVLGASLGQCAHRSLVEPGMIAPDNASSGGASAATSIPRPKIGRQGQQTYSDDANNPPFHEVWSFDLPVGLTGKKRRISGFPQKMKYFVLYGLENLNATRQTPEWGGRWNGKLCMFDGVYKETHGAPKADR